jgi:hypothetical protein
MLSVVKLTDTSLTPGSWRMLFSIVIAQLPQSIPAIFTCSGSAALFTWLITCIPLVRSRKGIQ